MAARDKYSGDIDVLKRMSQHGNEEDMSGKFAFLFGDSLFHNEGIVRDDGLHDEDLYFYFG